jgi:cytochrome c oxidase assembly protein subunit 15
VPEFNALKTWVEYVNRLLGVLVGFAVLGTAVTALPYWRVERTRVIAAFAAFVLVGFNGWLGSRVVATVLSPTLITVHMMAALAVVAALIVALAWRDQSSAVLHERSPMLLTMAAFALALVLVQVVLGTEVRSEVDAAAARLGEAARATWLNTLGGELLVHRALPAALLLVYVALGMRLHQEKVSFELGQTFFACLSLAMGNAALGFLLVAMGMPAWAQPLHLLGGTLLVGAHVLLLLQCLSLSGSSQANIVNVNSGTHARHA